MKKILDLLSFENLRKNLLEVSKRFPVSLVIISITAILFFSLTYYDFKQITQNNIIKAILSLIITFFISIGLYLSTESINNKKINKNIIQAISILFGFLFYLGIQKDADIFESINFPLTLFGFISYLFFALYIKKIWSGENKQSLFYKYFYNISSVFLISAILGVILFVLGYIGIMAVFELFDIISTRDIKNDIILYWSTTALVVITPIFALTKIPNLSIFSENKFTENIFFSFLVKYIAIPFICIYFIILYAYSIKILSDFDNWPKGEVSWMVIGFSIFGYIIYVYSYIFEEKSKFIHFFRKIFPYVVIPQVFMLFYAIYLRVFQYDITINRYFVIVFGIWLLIISLYYIFSKKKYLSAMFFLLTLFIVIISIGPWSVYSLPETRQYNRLVENLEKANILKNGEIKPLKNYEDINKQLSKNIYSGIDYLCNFNNCESIKNLFPNHYKQLMKKNEYKKNQVKKYEIVEYITTSIKVDSYYLVVNNVENIILELKDRITLFPIDTSGYNKITRLSDYDSNSKELYAKADIKNKKIKIITDKKVIETIDITKILDNLTKNYKENKNIRLNKSEMTYVLGKYKIILENISIDNPYYSGYKKDKYHYTSGYVLIKNDIH